MVAPSQHRPSKPPADLITKRLHISGLSNPAITHADLRQRFASFGQVEAVDGVGLDGNGHPRSFAFVTLHTTAPQVSRCLSLLSGATWKSCVLRIGEARPTVDVRLADERKRAAAEALVGGGGPAGGKARKKRRLGKGVHGVEAKHMEPIDAARAADKKHWHLTPLQHLVRPLLLQPLHPLPRPTLPVPSSSFFSHPSKPTLTPAPEAKRKKTGKRPPGPPARARRVVVDPRRYERTHLAGELLDPGSVGGGGVWVCQEGEGGEVIWVREGGEGGTGGREVVVVGREERLREVLRSLRGEVGGEQAAVGEVVLEDGEDEVEDEDEGEDIWPSLGPTSAAAAGLFADDDDDDDEEGMVVDTIPSPEDDDDDDFPSLLPASDERPASPLFATVSAPPAPAPASTPKLTSVAPVVPPAAVVHQGGKYAPAPPSLETTGPADPLLRAPSQPSQVKTPKPTPNTTISKKKPQAAGAKPLDPELAALVAAEKSRGLGVFASLFGTEVVEEGEEEDKEGGGAVSFLDEDDDEPTDNAPALKGKTALPSWVHDDSDSELDPTPPATVAARPKALPAAPKPKLKPTPKAAAPSSPVKKQVTFDPSVPIPPSPSPEPDLDTVMDTSDAVSLDGSPEVAEAEDEDEGELDPVQQAMKELREWEVLQEAKRLAAEESSAAAAGDDGAEEGVLRIRGGAREEDSEDEDEDAPARKKTDVRQLKAMFAPRTTEAPTVSLLGGLDLELDETDDPTLSAALPARRSPPPSFQAASQPPTGGAYVHPSRASFAPTLGGGPSYPVPQAPAGPSLPLGKQPFRPDASTPYFFSHLHLSSAEASKGPKQQSASLLALERDKKFNTGCGGFWRPQGEDERAVTAKWEEAKGFLTKDWKARAKGAKRKGRGGKGEDAGAEGAEVR